MATQACPVCSSEDVYSLLHTLHCKRCGNIWKEEKKTKCGCVTGNPDRTAGVTVRVKKVLDNSEGRMEQRLEEFLKKYQGKFSLNKITWTIGDIQMAIFRRYLKNCVKNRALVEKKDKYGIVWYSRPDKDSK